MEGLVRKHSATLGRAKGESGDVQPDPREAPGIVYRDRAQCRRDLLFEAFVLSVTSFVRTSMQVDSHPMRTRGAEDATALGRPQKLTGVVIEDPQLGVFARFKKGPARDAAPGPRVSGNA